MGDRTSFFYKIKRGLSNPSRIIPYYRHSFRNRKLAAESRAFIQYYPRVVDYNAANVSPDLAVGSSSRGHWVEIGKFQFDYLASRTWAETTLSFPGRRLRQPPIGFYAHCLSQSNCHVGVDISPNIVCAALRTIEEFNLQCRCPLSTCSATRLINFFPSPISTTCTHIYHGRGLKTCSGKPIAS